MIELVISGTVCWQTFECFTAQQVGVFLGHMVHSNNLCFKEATGFTGNWKLKWYKTSVISSNYNKQKAIDLHVCVRVRQRLNLKW